MTFKSGFQTMATKSLGPKFHESINNLLGDRDNQYRQCRYAKAIVITIICAKVLALRDRSDLIPHYISIVNDLAPHEY